MPEHLADLRVASRQRVTHTEATTFWVGLLILCVVVTLETGVLPTSWTLPNFFREIVGLPSPTSGVTRALRALVAGRLGEALMFHSAAVLAGLFFVGFMLYLPISVVAGRRVVTSRRVDRLVFWLMVCLTLAQWLFKMLVAGPRWW